MKIKLIKDHLVSGIPRLSGCELEVTNELGRTLIKKGYATDSDHVTGREQMAEETKSDEGEAEVEETEAPQVKPLKHRRRGKKVPRKK